MQNYSDTFKQEHTPTHQIHVYMQKKKRTRWVGEVAQWVKFLVTESETHACAPPPTDTNTHTHTKREDKKT